MRRSSSTSPSKAVRPRQPTKPVDAVMTPSKSAGVPPAQDGPASRYLPGPVPVVAALT